ncbi:MAG TPA: NAD-dependent epimerase/dehydratase family protein [Candidatus Dormibacteraeota bacterium]|nr:NAD-dependent epimerase/dehydratase family protein [Candidatus Dormibacteraeota bacterium]
MRAFVTGAAGFIGGSLVRQLRARGDEVLALVRDAGRADALRKLGCELIEGDLGAMPDEDLRAALEGSDALFHLAGSYRVGIAATEHAAMYQANVSATRAALDAAIAAQVPRMVYVSTANVFGDTRGRVVDETYRRPQPPRYLSYYDETKYLAHLAAEGRIATGAPILIAIPCMVYGPGDHSQVGATVAQAMAGRLPVINAPELGGSLVHVDDLAAGILLVHDKGTIGEQYVLGGEIATLREVVRRAAALAGKRPPLLSTPSWLLHAVTPLGGLLGRVLAGAPNVAEMVRASDGVTYWATDAKARVQLGYAPRDLEAGLRTLLPSA